MSTRTACNPPSAPLHLRDGIADHVELLVVPRHFLSQQLGRLLLGLQWTLAPVCVAHTIIEPRAQPHCCLAKTHHFRRSMARLRSDRCRSTSSRRSVSISQKAFSRYWLNLSCFCKNKRGLHRSTRRALVEPCVAGKVPSVLPVAWCQVCAAPPYDAVTKQCSWRHASATGPWTCPLQSHCASKWSRWRTPRASCHLSRCCFGHGGRDHHLRHRGHQAGSRMQCSAWLGRCPSPPWTCGPAPSGCRQGGQAPAAQKSKAWPVSQTS